jgi:hypothetical protein
MTQLEAAMTSIESPARGADESAAQPAGRNPIAPRSRSRGRLAWAPLVLLAATLLSHAQRADAQTPGAHLLRLTVSPASSAVRLGDTIALKALGDFDDGTVGVDLTASVTWSSTNAGVASVVAGVATGESAGTATIRAAQGSVQSDPATGSLRVVATLKKIALSPIERILPIKHSTLYHAIGTFEQGIQVDISHDVTFAVGDATVAQISLSGRARGKMIGKTQISATDTQTGISTTVPLTVVGAVQAVAVTPPSLALVVGGTALLKAEGTFAGDCHTFNYGSRLAWSSSSPGIATIDNEGNLHCVADGSTTISVRDRPTGITSTQGGDDAMVICGGSPTAIVVSPRKDVVPVGTERDLVATYVFPGGIQADGTRQVTWSTDQPSIVQIQVANGPVGKAVGAAPGPGSALIEAFDPLRNLSSNDPGGRNGKIHVPGAPASLSIFPTVQGTTLGGDPGTALRLTAQVNFADGSTRAVSKLVAWSSSAPAVVALSDGSTCAPVGTFELLSPGTATVSAIYPAAGGPGSVSTSVQIHVGPVGSASNAFLDAPRDLLD